MTIVNLAELREHASHRNYGLPVVRAFSLPVARGIIECADKQDAPVVFAVDGTELRDGLLPSLEAMARQAGVPVALLAVAIENTEQAVQAIRSGCQGVALAEGLSQSAVEGIHHVAESCGVTVVDDLSGVLIPIDRELENETLKTVGRMASSWHQIHTLITQAAVNYLDVSFSTTGAAGQGRDALDACEPWRLVEHLIVYNVTMDDTAAEEIAAEGQRVLAGVPGVRAACSGRAVQAGARYQWCWLIRFAHRAVIDSYREHPDHVAYADSHFRPVAGDRISIDYELET